MFRQKHSDVQEEKKNKTTQAPHNNMHLAEMIASPRSRNNTFIKYRTLLFLP